MMELNYLAAQGAIVNAGGPSRGVLEDVGGHPAAGEGAARAGSDGRPCARRGVVQEIDTMPPALRQALDAARDVPIDVDPIFSFDETVK